MCRRFVKRFFLNTNLPNNKWNNHLTAFFNMQFMSKNGLQFSKDCVGNMEKNCLREVHGLHRSTNFSQSNIFFISNPVFPCQWPKVGLGTPK